jgi:hypothetical protein
MIDREQIYKFEKKAAVTESIVPTINPTVTHTSDDIYWAQFQNDGEDSCPF